MLRTLSAALASGALVALTACGSGDAETTAEEENGNGGEETRVIDHQEGETEVPAEPERVVSLWAPTFSAMLALEEEPVAYAHNSEPLEGIEYPEGFDIDSLEHVGHSVELDFEEIAAVGPDLIIGTSVHEEMYDQLSEIAPTVILEWEGTGAWKQHLDDVAEVLAAEEAAEEVTAEYEARVEEVAEAVGEPEEIETSVVRFHAEELRLEVLNSFPGMILEDVGLARPEIQDVEEDGGFLPVSLENLPEADGDALFVYTIADAEEENPDLLAEAESSPLWENLEAVQNDAVYAVDYDQWLAANYIGAHGILDDLEEHLGQQ